MYIWIYIHFYFVMGVVCVCSSIWLCARVTFIYCYSILYSDYCLSWLLPLLTCLVWIAFLYFNLTFLKSRKKEYMPRRPNLIGLFFPPLPCCTLLYYTTRYFIILSCTILYHTILYNSILYNTIQYYTVLYYTVLYCTILYYTVLYYNILFL